MSVCVKPESEDNGIYCLSGSGEGNSGRLKQAMCVYMCAWQSQLLRADSAIWLWACRLPQRAAQERIEWKIKDDSEKMAFYRKIVQSL